MKLEVLSCNSFFTLWVVDAFHYSFWTVVVHVIEVVSPRKLFAAQLTLEKYKLAFLLEVVSHLDLQDVFQTELTDLKSVRACLSVLRHCFPHYPGLASRIQTHDELILARLFVFGEFSVDWGLCAPVAVVAALDLEEVVKLILEGN